MSNQTATMLGDERISKRNLWGYSLGGVGRDMVYQIINGFLLPFMIFTKGLSNKEILIIGFIFLGCRIFDGCNDPIMGALIERTRTKWGKFKPWIMIGMITNIIVIFALFFVPLTGKNYVIFFGFMYLLWGITYTMNDISYWGMMPSLTSNHKDRDSLATIANIGAGIGAGLVIISAPVLTAGGSISAPFAYKLIAGVACAVFAGCQIMTCCVVKEKPLPPAPKTTEKKPNPLKQMFVMLKGNDQVRIIMVSMCLYNLGSAIMLGFSNYWVYIRYGYVGLLATLFTVLSSISAVIILFYPMLTKKFTRKQIATISYVMMAVGYSLLLIVGLVTAKLPGDATNGIHIKGTTIPTSLIFIALCGAIASFGQTLFYQVQTISMANCIEYNDLKTGDRDEGTIFACRPFMAKLASAFKSGIDSAVLAGIGIKVVTDFISDTENYAAAAETAVRDTCLKGDALKEAITAINDNKINAIGSYLDSMQAELLPKHMALIAIMSVLPLVLLSIAYFMYMKMYKIDENYYEEICQQLAERNALAAQAEDDEACDQGLDATDDAVAEYVADAQDQEDENQSTEDAQVDTCIISDDLDEVVLPTEQK